MLSEQFPSIATNKRIYIAIHQQKIFVCGVQSFCLVCDVYRGLCPETIDLCPYVGPITFIINKKPPLFISYHGRKQLIVIFDK